MPVHPKPSRPRSRAASSSAPAAAADSVSRKRQGAPAPSRFWLDWRAADFAAPGMDRMVAILPVAAIEQHGPHLPVSVDTAIADAIVRASLAHLPARSRALFLPTQSIGKSNEHAAFAGTLSFSSETILRVWTEIGDAVAAAGIRKLILFNTHGGQVSVMDLVARDLRIKHEMIVVSTSWFNLPVDFSAFSAHEMRFGVHGGEVETSMMLAIAPERVDMTQAENFASSSETRSRQYPVLGNGRSAKYAWATQDLNPAGVAGNAKAATAARGQALIEDAGLHLAALIGEVEQLPLSTVKRGTRWRKG